MTRRTTTFGTGMVATAFALITITGCGSMVDPVDPAARQALMQSLGNTSFTVFSAFVRDADERYYDAESADLIGAFLAGDGLANVTVSESHVPITGPWHSNQFQMLQESAAAFAAHLEENPPETDYALLAEYIFLGGEGGVGGIHCYILDTNGNVAHVVLLNSHHNEFSDAEPETVPDCTDVLIGVLRDDLVPGE